MDHKNLWLVISVREYRFAAVRHAMFGQDCFRFAAMLGVWNTLLEPLCKLMTYNLGSFVSLYKYILNALPLLYRPPESQFPFADDDDDIELGPPRPVGKRVRKLRLSVSGKARQAWTEKRTRAWFSVAAGATAGGVAIMFEKQSRRTGIGQQMFVRSVQSARISAA